MNGCANARRHWFSEDTSSFEVLAGNGDLTKDTAVGRPLQNSHRERYVLCGQHPEGRWDWPEFIRKPGFSFFKDFSRSSPKRITPHNAGGPGDFQRRITNSLSRPYDENICKSLSSEIIFLRLASTCHSTWWEISILLEVLAVGCRTDQLYAWLGRNKTYSGGGQESPGLCLSLKVVCAKPALLGVLRASFCFSSFFAWTNTPISLLPLIKAQRVWPCSPCCAFPKGLDHETSGRRWSWERTTTQHCHFCYVPELSYFDWISFHFSPPGILHWLDFFPFPRPGIPPGILQQLAK